VPGLLSPADLQSIEGMLPSGSAHVIQRFLPDHALDPGLRSVAVSPNRARKGPRLRRRTAGWGQGCRDGGGTRR